MAVDKNVRIIISAKDDASSKISSLGSSISGAIGGITKALSVATVAAGGFALKSAADMEQTAVAFRTMLGDAGQAQAVLSQLSKFAADTPFEFPEIANAGKQLLAFGTAAQDIQPQLTMIGDLASGLGVPLSQLTYAFGQVQVAGRLMGQDLMQFTNAGVPLIAALSQTMGVAQSEVKKMVEQGKIGFADVQKALESLTAEGGKFHGMMAQQSKTLSGLWSTLSDNLGNLGRQILGISTSGQVMAGSMFDRLRTAAAQFIEKVAEMTPAILEFVADLQNSFGVAFGTIIDLGKFLYNTLGEIF